MSLATAPPIRFDIGARENDDYVVPARWLRADRTTPISISSAKLTMRFDLDDDDTWPLDPTTGEPVPPPPQTHVIATTSVGSPGGWIGASRYGVGEVTAVISHDIWAGVTPPWSGTWDLVATSVDSIQRVLVRGEFVCEESP